MKRLEFLRGIFTGSLGIIIPGFASGVSQNVTIQTGTVSICNGSLNDPERRLTLLETQVAGYQYYQGKLVEPGLKAGMPLGLIREPNNSYDSNAIAVYYGQTKIGFIPRAENAVLANILDQGMLLNATLKAFNPNMPAWGRVELEVFMTI